ncbi:hypothetical protein GBF38_000019, partial [Nibea albiflora]
MKNKIMKKDLDEMHGHEESWKLWMKEAEQRERQQAGKEMPRCSGKESGKECFATDTCKPSPSAPSEYVEAKSEMMALRHKHDDESYAFRPDPADSTTMVMPQPTNPLHPSLLHPNHNMPMVEYPGPTGPIRVQRGWTDPDMMEAGKTASLPGIWWAPV